MLPEYITARVAVRDSGCHEWTRYCNKKGYGVVSVRGVGNRLFHRLVWEDVNGPVPKGQILRHTCDNPPCGLLDHLILGTHQENSDDMYERGNPPVGERNGRTYLTENQVRMIRSQYDLGDTIKVLMAKWNLPRTTVHNIVTRKRWRHM